MSESQKSWEKLIGTRFDDEANFAVALAEYYKMTLFNKSPKNTEKLNAVFDKMRKALSKNDETALYLSLSYIWVLREQKLWDEAANLSAKFFEKYPDNTMMIRAMQAIAIDGKDIPKIYFYSKKLTEILQSRSPLNYSDMLSAKRAEIIALNLENRQNEACFAVKNALEFSQSVPEEYRKIYWVKKHIEYIESENRKCMSAK